MKNYKNGKGASACYDGICKPSTPWYKYAEKIKKVVVKKGVTGIGNYAFAGLTKVTKVTLPESLTKIGREAFENCQLLTEICIPAQVSQVGNSVFRRCSAMKKVEIKTTLLPIRQTSDDDFDDDDDDEFGGGYDKVFKGIAEDAQIIYPESVKDAYDRMFFPDKYSTQQTEEDDD